MLESYLLGYPEFYDRLSATLLLLIDIGNTGNHHEYCNLAVLAQPVISNGIVKQQQ